LYYFLGRYTRKAKLSGAPKALLLSVGYSGPTKDSGYKAFVVRYK
jgi:hypothetical protein